MIQNFKKYISLAVLMILAVSATVPAAMAAPANQTYYGDLTSNYYSFYGGPDIHAGIQGNGEYDRGQTATVPITLSNKGVVEGFRSERNVKSDQPLNLSLQQMEVQNLPAILNAVGVVAVLESDVPGIIVKTGPQEAGTLPSGATTGMPLRYSVDIQRDVPAGDYQLTLNVTYKHLRNVIYNADSMEPTGPRNLNASYWYNENVTQEIPVTITVKEATRFEIVNVAQNLSAKRDGDLIVTYRNTGEETARSATVRLSTATPFSTTDDQSYLGTVEPGQEAVAVFKISVAEDSVVYDKNYALNSEILYEDSYGHQQISDVQKIELSVAKEPFWTPMTILIAIILILLLAVGVYYIYMSRKYKREGLNRKPFDGIIGKVHGSDSDAEKLEDGKK